MRKFANRLCSALLSRLQSASANGTSLKRPLPATVLEWSGSIVGLAGAFLLASQTEISRYGWFAFLAANFAVIGFARMIRAHGLLVQQCGFTLTSLLGIYRAFWPHL